MLSIFARRQTALLLGLTLTLAGGMLAAAPAFAFQGRIERVGAARQGIGRFDRNGDGKLSREEHAAGARELFDAMDTNHDGKVTATEMADSMAKVKGRRPSKSMKAKGEPADARIKSMDRDSDGVVSAEESAQTAKALFDKMDADKNGLVDSAELANSRSHPAQKAH